MKEIYDWVPWFRELAEKIADCGERELIEKTKQITWSDEGKTQPLLRYGDSYIDPFSFLYTIASRSGTPKSRNLIYPSVNAVFKLERELDLDADECFIFPISTPINLLFHGGEGTGDPALLWRLFRDAVSGIESVRAGDFEGALKIRNVATRKLTQVLFLVNPHDFLPIDDQTKSLGVFDSVPTSISWEHYRQLIDQTRSGLRGCRPCEANLLSYLISSGQLSRQPNNAFQISTNVHDDNVDHWEEFESNNHVYVGWVGKKRKYPLDEPKRGDVILVRFGVREGRGIGVVYENEYRNGFDEDRRIHVLWLNKVQATLSGQTTRDGFSRAGSGTIEAFRQTTEYAPTFALLDRLRGEGPGEDPPPNESREENGPPLNRILYGPPGTGKTWRTGELARAIIDRTDESPKPDIDRIRETFNNNRFDSNKCTDRIATVTFHQSFAYEDFIEGIRPVLEGDSLTYEMRDGVFKSIANAARQEQEDAAEQGRSSERFVLIIDEINRGNVAKIFGELITLIEDSKRIGGDDETWVTLPYSREGFGVPDNLYIIGTMNTADRSIQLLDTALRRRFTFLEMMPNPEHENICRDIEGVDCSRMLLTMNERIAALLDREHQIGHTYLLDVDDMDKLSEVFRSRIFPLLQEYFFDDWAKIRAILGHNGFVTERRVENLFRDSDRPDDREFIYERLPDEAPGWRQPSEYRKIYRNAEVAEQEGT